MVQKSDYYELLGISRDADPVVIRAVYETAVQKLAASDSRQERATAEERMVQLRQAYEVLSSPTRRADYDAGLALLKTVTAMPDRPLQVEVALEASRRSPIRILLTVIATVMIIGLVIQMGAMFMAYRHTRAVINNDGTSPAAEKIYLQDFYQTYGIRANSREEAELLLADMRRKEQAANEESRKAREAQEQEYNLKRFEEESRREGAQISADLRRAEQQIAWEQEQERRRKEAEEQAKREAEQARIEREAARWRRYPSSSRSEE